MSGDRLSPDEFADMADVSRETFEDFQKYEALLTKWNRKINLVSPKAAQDFWGRHALDSWQITKFIDDTHLKCLDLGSGAGFPAIAVAIYLKHKGQGSVTLVESAGKKAAFLRTVIRELELPAKVWADRAEDLTPEPYDLITARAFAPLPQLLTYAHPFWGEGTCALLLKGERVKDELTDAAQMWIYEAKQTGSISDSTGVVLKINNLRAKAN